MHGLAGLWQIARQLKRTPMRTKSRPDEAEPGNSKH
jgi:hypothetical protein